MLIKFIRLYPDAQAPVRASPGAVGYDVYAYHVVGKETEADGKRKREQDLPYTLLPGKSVLIGTGIIFAVPWPVDCQVRPRSGLATKFDVELSNSPGTVDPDYRGEIGILLRNRGEREFVVTQGMRVAQLVFTKIEVPGFVEVDALPPTTRSTGGFGSTGLLGDGHGEAEFKAEQLKFDRHWMRVAASASGLSDCLRGADKNADGSYSKDGEGRYRGGIRRFGCVIVREGNPIGTGYNSRNSECSEKNGCVREREGIPSGHSNDRGCWHAEEAAFQSMGRTGGNSLGATLYVTAEPCIKCAKLIIGYGISAVVVPTNVYKANALSMLEDAGIEVRRVDP